MYTMHYGSKHSDRHARRMARRNPDESLPKEAGMTVVASVIGVAVAVGIENLVNGMKKPGGDQARYSDKQVSGITAAAGALIGVGLHVKGIAPRVGKAIIAGSGALAASRFIAHRKDTAEVQAARLAGARGISVAPVLVSEGYGYGYLPSSSGAVGAQYGIVQSGAAIGAQYGTMVR
jgi:hypothetical protein